MIAHYKTVMDDASKEMARSEGFINYHKAGMQG